MDTTTQDPTNRDLAQSIVISREWQVFSRGHWQTERPTEPGTYPIASRDGYFEGCWAENVEHDGFWWSEALPELPAPPEWPS